MKSELRKWTAENADDAEQQNMIRKTLGMILMLIAFAAVFAAIGEETLTKRLAWIVLAIGCPLMSMSLEPKIQRDLWQGLRQGLDEFKRAFRGPLD